MAKPSGPLHLRRHGIMRGYLSDIAHRSLPIVLYLVLLVGAGIDVATFYQVLALVLQDVPDPVVWVGVAGFTVVALTLAHMVGMRLREHTTAFRPVWTSLAAWLCLGVWLLVGIVAFVIRLLMSTESSSVYEVNGQAVLLEASDGISGTEALLPALLFLALYAATGTVAAVAGYTVHQPGAATYRRTLRDRSKAAKASARGEEMLAHVRETINLINKQGARVLADLDRAEVECDALSERLRRRTRILLLARSIDGQGTTPPPDGHAARPSDQSFGDRLEHWPPYHHQTDSDLPEDHR